jgi:hypothetical protein
MSDRRRRISFDRQLRMISPLVMIWAVAGSILLVAGLQTQVPIRVLLLDPSALGDLPWYSGILSNVGILAWTVAAASAGGGAWVASQTDRPSAARFLGTGAIVAGVLLLDDLLLLHSNLLPRTLGVPKAGAMLLIVLPAIGWLAVFAGEIMRTRWAILLGALSAFFVSVAADQVLHPSGSTALLFEDGAKFLGVLAWSLYFVLTTHDIVKSTIQAAKVRASVAAAGPTTEPSEGSPERPATLQSVLDGY